MRDCPNLDVRDLLPELLHERLSAPERDRVSAHLADCVDCSDELTLLRDARGALLASAPGVDAAAIARAVQARLATPTTQAVAAAPFGPLRVVRGDAPAASRGPARRIARWSSPQLRAAAAVVVMALGAGGVLVAHQGTFGTATPVAPRSTATTGARVAAPTPTPTRVVTPPVAERDPRATEARPTRVAATSALGATFSDLSDEELAAVLRAVDGGDASLPADPAPSPAVVGTGGLE